MSTPIEIVARTPRSLQRWKVLAIYSAAAGLSQFLWLNLAPLLSLVERKYGVTEDRAGLLLMVFPLTYVLLSIPAGAVIDRRGYRFGIGLGVSVMAAFACLRVVDGGFGVLLAAQAGMALGQPFVVNGISKLVLDWFGTPECSSDEHDKHHNEQGIATGLGTVGMFLGMALGMSVTPPLVEALGFQPTMALFAAIAVAICVGFFVIVRPNHSRRSEDQQSATSGDTAALTHHLRALLGNRHLVLIFVLAFLGLGFFNGLTTWLEPILAPHGITSVQAGMVGASLILGGVLGAALIPALSDRFGRRKPFLIGSVVAALATLYPLCTGSRFSTLLALGSLLGFFFLPAYSLLLEACSELAGPARAGAATGILMLTGNTGGVAVILGMQWVKSEQTGFAPAVDLLALLLALAICLAFFVRETHPRAASRS